MDLVEEKNDAIEAFECKWKQEKTKAPAAFAKAYPDAPFSTIHQKKITLILSGKEKANAVFLLYEKMPFHIFLFSSVFQFFSQNPLKAILGLS